jgi:hypothetical protein
MLPDWLPPFDFASPETLCRRYQGAGTAEPYLPSYDAVKSAGLIKDIRSDETTKNAFS